VALDGPAFYRYTALLYLRISWTGSFQTALTITFFYSKIYNLTTGVSNC